MSSHPESAPASVSIRELNHGASAVINRVHETRVPVVITNHGKPWAKIVPIEEAITPYERLKEMGNIKPRKRTSLPDLTPVKLSRPSSEVLGELREERL